jgi:hypothetical protein
MCLMRRNITFKTLAGPLAVLVPSCPLISGRYKVRDWNPSSHVDVIYSRLLTWEALPLSVKFPEVSKAFVSFISMRCIEKSGITFPATPLCEPQMWVSVISLPQPSVWLLWLSCLSTRGNVCMAGPDTVAQRHELCPGGHLDMVVLPYRRECKVT